jgi:hypothetical protein
VTVALAITPPDGSVTVPETLPVIVWAATNKFRSDIASRLNGNFVQCFLKIDMGRISPSTKIEAGHRNTGRDSPGLANVWTSSPEKEALFRS